MARREILPDELYDSTRLEYTHAIVSDGTLHVSGQVATDADGSTVGDDIETQTRQAFENVGVILDKVDRGFDDVLKVTGYVVDLQERYDGYKSAWSDYFDEPYPCHTLLGVDQLAGEDYLVELEVEVPVDG